MMRTDAEGAISLVPPDEPLPDARTYRNLDGHRVDDGRYAAFAADVSNLLPSQRIITDPLRTFAYGTDASAYRLTPAMVLKVSSEAEVASLLPLAAKHAVPVTFRAAGTSLSGQALTDSVLVKLSHVGTSFRRIQVHGDGSSVTAEPGAVGGEVNRELRRHAVRRGEDVAYKIGPDPSSIDSCMIGGIVANNSSGMCCGVAQNSYHTLQNLRLVFADGTVLDSADGESRRRFLERRRDLTEGVVELAREVRANVALSAKIRSKFAIKCTTGYSLNALLDSAPDDAIGMIRRLAVGSEGTLCFVSSATFATVPDWAHKASAFVLFPSLEQACLATAALRASARPDAVELFDRASLRSCERDARMMGLVPGMRELPAGAAALLVECRARDAEGLEQRCAAVHQALLDSGVEVGVGGHGEAWSDPSMVFRRQPLGPTGEVLKAEMRESTHPEAPSQGCTPPACGVAGCADSTPGHVHVPRLEGGLMSLEARPSPVPASILRACRFLSNAQGAEIFWELRRGLIPLVGANREKGTTSLLEDVACPVPRLASMTDQITRMLREGGYADAYAFGHALEGNLHLAFSQGMRSAREVERFERTMESLASIVLDHDGSLKAEHGTGRNMAPFVGAEWGPEALDIMWRIKHLFDPGAVLNPGVVLSRDPLAHVRKLKPCPPVHHLVDRCIECGFCESNCPSRDLSLTPRQRIVSLREMRRLEDISMLPPAQAAAQERRSSPPASSESDPTASPSAAALPLSPSAAAARLAELRGAYAYQGEQTCAADGMCQVKCPVAINTGSMVKDLRRERYDRPKAWASRAARWAASHMEAVCAGGRATLRAVRWADALLPDAALAGASRLANKLSGRLVPVWNPWVPGPAPGGDWTGSPDPPATPKCGPLAARGSHRASPLRDRRVVLFPSCVTRIMGPHRPGGAQGAADVRSAHERVVAVVRKAGFRPVLLPRAGAHCCGMLFDTRGFPSAGEGAREALGLALQAASEGGVLPVVVDTSPCLETLRRAFPELRQALLDPAEVTEQLLAPHLVFSKTRAAVSLHVPCSAKRMGLEPAMRRVAERCAAEVRDSGVPCCGTGGDRGFRFPELSRAALQHLDVGGCQAAYSSSRTCQISLAQAAGMPFDALMTLVDESTQAKRLEF